MKILVASDSFKGSLTSSDIGEIVKAELAPFHEVDSIALSDGGEGFLEAIKNHTDTTFHSVEVSDPLNRKHSATYLLTADHKTAYIESALVCGHQLLDQKNRNPMTASTYGLGEMILDAISKGSETIYLGLGGSATNEAGTGLMQALGVRFFDLKGREITDRGGQILESIAVINTENYHPAIQNIRFIGVCDVNNPLLGINGTTIIYGPQKGADTQMIIRLEKGMESYSRMISSHFNQDFSGWPGSGAAGGLGFCIKSFLSGDLLPGAETVRELIGLGHILPEYDLIITGEGQFDEQTRAGKVPMSLLQIGKKNGIPVICLCGINNSETNPGFLQVFSIVPEHGSTKESIKSPEEYLRKMIRNSLLPWMQNQAATR